jgi:virulence-associated protein VagC
VDASLGQNNRSASLRLPRIRHKLSQIITQKRELR